MKAHLGEILNLFILTSLACCAAHPKISNHSLLIPVQNYRTQCDPRTAPPIRPSFQDCHEFLWDLSIKSHTEPQGAFKWYGRNIGPCDDCVELPTLVYFKDRRCAAVIDVDDKDRQDFSVFDLKDLWQALSGMVEDCWLRKRRNGRSYPGSQTAWAGLVEGFGTEPGLLTKASLVQGNRSLTMLDLSEQGTKSVAKSPP